MALTGALALLVGGTGTGLAIIGSPLGPDVLPDVACAKYDYARSTCINKSDSGTDVGPATGPKTPSKGSKSGPTTCTATDPSTGKKVTGPISSKPVDPQPAPDPRGPGQWKWIYCGDVLLHMEWVLDSASAAAHQVSVSTFPQPHIHMNPDPNKGADPVVGVTTWLWVDSNDMTMPPSRTQAGPVVTVATFTATPTVTWDMGDGSPAFTCQGPGKPWTPGATPDSQTCTYTFKDSSAGHASGQTKDAFTVTATITWTVTWTDGTNGGTLGPFDQTSTVPLHVSEVQAINNG
jgi:hypothetical protein